MESTSTTTDQQTAPALPMNNSSSRRKQSKPNRLEHVVLDTAAACETLNASPLLPSLTQYHVAAEQQESGLADDDSDRVSLNCEDGSLSSPSTAGEHYAMEDIINRSRRPVHHLQSHANAKSNFNENLPKLALEGAEHDEQHDSEHSEANVLDFSMKLDELAKQSTHRARSINPLNKSRSLKRKHHNGLTEHLNGSGNAPARIFHADAFCSICRKEFCNKYFLKTHLANKHGIFDQSAIPSVSAASLSSLQGSTDTNTEGNLQHPFTVISTLLHNGHEDLSSSPHSPSSDLLTQQANADEEENESELSSLRREMNGVLAGDDEQQQDEQEQNDDEQDDEQDGTNSSSLRHLPQQIATILGNDNADMSAILNENDEDDEDNNQRDSMINSPSNSLDYQQQQQHQQQASSSHSTLLSAASTTSASRQSSAKTLEDFCDICQKHFCNKYYLRKHRLDVHGVQTESNIKPYKRIDSNSLLKSSPPSTSQISPSIQLPSSFPNVAFNPASVQQSLGMLLNPIFSPLVQSQSVSEQSLLSSSNKRRHTDNSNESSSSSLSLAKPQFPPSLLTAASDVANAFASQLTSASSSTSKSQISTCHFCGKKFQSNDYLQLHLLNKHQILLEKQEYESQPTQRTKLSNLIKASNGAVNSNTVKKIKLETNETPSPATSTVIKAASPLDTMASSNSSTVMPGIVDTYFAAKMADRVSCDICHKQVCNKYFLKTHKLKVHGVGPDTSAPPSSSNPLASLEGNDDTAEQQQQSRSSFDGSPPQLVVDELNSTTAEPGVIPSPDALTASVNTCIGTNSSSTTDDSTEQVSTTNCELCAKSFPTKFFHVHMNNVHGIQQAPLLLTNGTASSKSHLAGSGLKRSLTNGSNASANVRLKQTPQVQLRVTCQVCKKELCNKYFLRAHMRNVHNISVDDFRLIQQKSPSSEQASAQGNVALAVNLLSSGTSTPTDMNIHSTSKYSSSPNDNDFNGHTTDSNESENLQHYSPSTSLITTTSAGTNDNNNNNNHLLSMQPFLVESDDDLYKDLFVPCMVYLPCRHRVTKPLEVSLRLKPVENPTSTTNAATVSTAD